VAIAAAVVAGRKRGLLRQLPRNETLKRGLYSLGGADRLARFQQVFSIVPEHLDDLFQPGLFPNGADREATACWEEFRPAMSQLDDLNAFQLLELRSSLPDELLMYGDKLSMPTHSKPECLISTERWSNTCKNWAPRSKCATASGNGSIEKCAASSFPPRSFSGKSAALPSTSSTTGSAVAAGRIKDYLADDQSLLYQYLRHDAVADLLKRHSSGREDRHKVLSAWSCLSSGCAATPLPLLSTRFLR